MLQAWIYCQNVTMHALQQNSTFKHDNVKAFNLETTLADVFIPWHSWNLNMTSYTPVTPKWCSQGNLICYLLKKYYSCTKKPIVFSFKYANFSLYLFQVRLWHLLSVDMASRMFLWCLYAFLLGAQCNHGICTTFLCLKNTKP